MCDAEDIEFLIQHSDKSKLKKYIHLDTTPASFYSRIFASRARRISSGQLDDRLENANVKSRKGKDFLVDDDREEKNILNLLQL